MKKYDTVIGATLNKNGSLTVEATKVGKDTALAFSSVSVESNSLRLKKVKL